MWLDGEYTEDLFFLILEDPTIMATIPPPPTKKQKTAASNKARDQQELDLIPTDLGNVRVRFFDETTGNVIGDTISIPVADATTKNLELLVNSLLGKQVSHH